MPEDHGQNTGRESGPRGGSAVARRVGFLLGTLALLAVGGFAGYLAMQGSEPTAEDFHGSFLERPQEARGFTLANHRGETVSLEDMEGQVVALTFLYTSCVDVCPFVGIKLKQAGEELGDAADNVEFVAITVDPERDTRDETAEYSRELDMYDRWHFLTGEQQELEPVWEAYHIGQPRQEGEAVFASQEDLEFYGLTNGLEDPEVDAANTARREFGGGYEVSHVTPIWLLDRDGMMRVKADTAATPKEIADDLRVLLSE
ncbi:MAG: SCO family protein [Chloroflexota bacterium]